jgi:hypothetical protein
LIIFIINVLNPFDGKSTLSMTHIRMTIGCIVLSLSGLFSGPANAASSGLQYINRTTANGLASLMGLFAFARMRRQP